MEYAIDDKLHEAARMGDLAALNHLIKAGTDLEEWSGADDAPPLVVAAAHGQAEAVRLLLDRGANIFGWSEYGHTALHVAAENGHAHVVRLLLERGGKVDVWGEGGTPLMGAARAGQVECARVLLDAGAALEARDEMEVVTAAEWARRAGHTELANLLNQVEYDRTHDGEGLPLTGSAFTEYVDWLADLHQETALSVEDYLRALWGLVYECKGQTPSYTLFARLLARAFSAPPVPFEVEWRSFTQPPREGERASLSDFEFLRRTLLFQIADLHGMGDEVWNNPYRGLGLSSPTGNTWYNFDPVLYLECAASGIRAHSGKDAELEAVSWSTLASLLELGRLYE